MFSLALILIVKILPCDSLVGSHPTNVVIDPVLGDNH